MEKEDLYGKMVESMREVGFVANKVESVIIKTTMEYVRKVCGSMGSAKNG